MIKVVHGHIFITTFLGWVTFFPLAVLLRINDLFSLLAGLNIVASIVVLISYWPAVANAYRTPPAKLDYSDFLTLGIMFSMVGSGGRVGYLEIFRIINDTVDNFSYAVAFFQWMAFCAAVLHLSARRVPDGSNFNRVIGTIICGAILGTVMAMLD